jgi:hypothetical protein
MVGTSLVSGGLVMTFLFKMALIGVAVLVCTLGAGLVRALVEPSNAVKPVRIAPSSGGSSEPPQPVPTA